MNFGEKPLEQTDIMEPMAYELRHVELWVFVAVCVAVALACCLTLVFLVFNLRYRRLRVLKMSSPNINILIVAGSVLLYTSCVLYGLDYHSQYNVHTATYICQTRTWLLTIGVTFVFGAMFTKAWRVHRIFQHAAVKRVVIRDEQLVLVICGFVVLDAVILGFWRAFDPLTVYIRYRNTVDLRTFNSTSLSNLTTSNNRAFVYQTCTSNYFPLWIALLLTYKGVLLIYGTYLAWMIRNVTLPSMNDSKSIISSAYTSIILGSLTIALSITLGEWPNASFLCVSIGLIAGTTALQCYIFVPKIILWRKHRNEETLKNVNMSAQVINMSRDESYERIEEEMYHLLCENRSLKKSLSEKDVTIQTLQGHVNNAKNKLHHIVEEGKQDSGLDIDLSTSSDNVQLGQMKTGDYICRQNSLQRTISNSSTPRDSWFHGEPILDTRPNNGVSSFTVSRQKINRLRDSIAEDLDCAHTLSCNLRNSISHDLSPRRRSVHAGCDVKSKQELTGSIVDSYDLSDESDTYSYVSSHLGSCEFHGSLQSRWHSRRRWSCSSCESVYAIDNDKFYPDQKRKKRKRSKRIGRKGQWKQEPKPKIYTIQGPQEPMVQGSTGVAFTRTLTDCISEPGTFV